MKKPAAFLLVLFLSLLCAAALADVDIDRNFPDFAFRKYVKESFDKNGDGKLSDGEIAEATWVSCNNLGIRSLQGIECLTEADYLDCSRNPMQTFDIRRNTKLTSLTCSDMRLVMLDVSKNSELKELYCTDTDITGLDVSMCKQLEILYCRNNRITFLELGSLPKLKILVCEDNDMKQLDLSGVPGLTRLACGNNNLSKLNVTGLAALKDLTCDANRLGSLDVRKNTALEYLSCSACNLKSLDVSRNKKLVFLCCNSNRLSSLDISAQKKLYALMCCANNIRKVKIGKCPILVELVTGSEAVSLDDTWLWGDKQYRNKTSLWIDKTTAVNYGNGELSGLVKSITLNRTKVTLVRTSKKLNPTVKLKATVKPDSAVRKTVTWKSSNPKVAKVDPKTGKVTGLKAGTAVITCRATDGSKVKAACTVTVKNKPVKSITLNKKTARMKVGKSLKLKVRKIAPDDAVNRDVKWKSSDKKIATVDRNGKVTAKKPGTCEITCMAKDGSKVYVVCRITVR